MSIIVQYLLLAFIVSASLAMIFSLLKNSFLNYRHIHINNVEEFSKHYYRYMLYFWGVGIFVPASELYIEVFKIRKESEINYNLIVGIVCLGIAFGSKYFRVIRVNLHNLFVAFFAIYNSLILFKISTLSQMDYLTLAEFTIVNMISYYVFYSAKYFYVYFSAITVALIGLLLSKTISTQDFIIYFNSSFIAFIINYVIHYIDLSIKENLLFAYKFVNKGNLLVIGVNKEGSITFVSENIKDILQYNKEEWIDKNWENEVKKYFDTQNLDGITSIKNKEGNNIFFDWHEEFFSEDLMLQVGRDISQLKKTETQLRSSNNRLNTLLSNIGDLVFVIDVNYIFTEYYQNENENEGDLFLPSSVFIGKSIFEVGFPENALTKIKDAIDKALKTNRKSNIEYSLELPLGKQWFSVVISTLSDEEGKVLELICIARNITERKKAEIALKQSYEELKTTQNELLETQIEQEKFVNLVKYSDAFIAMANMKGEVLFVNEKVKRFFDVEDSKKTKFLDYYYTKEHIELLEKHIIPKVLVDGLWRGELYIYNKNEIRNTAATVFMIKNPNTGEIIALATVQIDITERKKAEAKILENQQQLIYKSEILAAIAKTTEKLLISKNIIETLTETFNTIGKAANVDRVYFFENDLITNRISQKVEWVKDKITPQINKSKTQNLSFDDIYFYTELLLQNKIFQKNLSELTDQRLIDRWQSQHILCVLLLPIIIKDKFHGFIGFDDCTQEQVWSDDKVNILQSLATNIANAIERINNELIIEESENNFRQLNETLEDVFFLFDFPNRKYIYISPSCKKVLGADQNFFYSGQSYIEEFLLEEDHNINDYIESQLQKEGSSDIEYRIKTKEGQIKWIQEKTFAIKNDENQLIRISGICIDITEKKLIQNEIKQLSLVAEKIQNGVLISDVEGKVLWANQGCLDMMEVPLDELLGKRPRDLFLPDDSTFKNDNLIMDNINYTLELETLTFKKNKKWIQINNTAIKNDLGDVIQQIEVIIDITERKKNEKALAEERKLLRAIIDNVPVNIYLKDTHARKILANTTDFKYAGFKSEQDVLGKTDFDLYEQASAQKAYNEDMLVINTKQALIEFESPHTRKDGSNTWLLVSKIPLKNEQDIVTGLVGISIDITDRKKSQQLLQESQQKLSSILNSLDEVVWAMSVPDYKLLFVSQSFEKVYGKTTKEWRRDFNIWKTLIHEEDKAIGERIESDLLNFGVSYGIYRVIGKNNTLKWLETTTKMIKGVNGNPFMFMGITTDITEKKLAEEALLKANEETETANKAKAELELRALQMQMNPHFIFNALNSIQSYVMNQDTLTANTYLSKFARLIRLFLDSSRSKFIPLTEEINLLNLYIELEKIRFENKFDFEILIGNQVNKYFEIPTMILQPFVENAINHGLRYKNTKGLLSIKFYHEEDFLICKIEDNGVGRRNSDRIQGLSKKGYQSQGLKITTERLTTYNKINNANIVFSINDMITNPINDNEEVGTIIEIRFPEN